MKIVAYNLTYISYNIPLTETGNNIIKAYYNNEEIVLTNNLVKVVNSEVDFSKTKLIYNSVSYPADSTLNVAKSSLPSISVQLYDTNNNIITSPNLVSTNILFNKDSSTQYICESNLSGTKTLYVCKDKVEDWLNLSNGEYELQYNVYIAVGVVIGIVALSMTIEIMKED